MKKGLIGLSLLVLVIGIWTSCNDGDDSDHISGTVSGLNGSLTLEIWKDCLNPYTGDSCEIGDTGVERTFSRTISSNGKWNSGSEYKVGASDSWRIAITQQPDGQNCTVSKTESLCGKTKKDDVDITCVTTCPDLTIPTTANCADGLSAYFEESAATIAATVVAPLEAMTGGTIKDGIYKMTAVESTGSAIFYVQYIKFESCGDTGSNMIVEIFTPGTTLKEKWMYTIKGTTLTMNKVCPSLDGPKDFEFTATETEFRVNTNSNVLIFTKQN